MTLLTRSSLNQLLEPTAWPCVSLYLPTHRLGPEIQQDPIRLKNLLREAERRLQSLGVRAPDVSELLGPAWRLQADGFFWRHQREGLAVFLSHTTHVHYRLPQPFDELVVVADRFHVKPLLSFLGADVHFYVLALSQNQVRLLEGSRFSVGEVEIDEMPADLREALGSKPLENQLQFHTGAPGVGGGRAAMFHGHGQGGEESKERLLEYFRRVDSALSRHLRDERSPLVLAGVEYYFSIYREANSYPHLVEGGIAGNPEAQTIDDLHGRALGLVSPLFEDEKRKAASRYRELAGTGRTSNRLEETVSAAIEGRVEVLFVAVGVQFWGSLDDSSRIVRHETPEPSDFDLLDLAAVRTLLQGGTVYAVRPQAMPDDNPLAAILRY